MLKADLLSYIRNGHKIFSDISFIVETGTCMIVRGENGSGKTTLLKLLAGYLPIQEGNFSINGIDTSNNYDFLAQHVDYIGHLNATKKQMTVWENLKLWNNLCEPKTHPDIENKFCDPMEINNFKNQLISFCSVGQVRRVALSKLMTNNKKLWLLDEPTTSLDESAIKNFYKMVETHCLKGGSAIIATHGEITMRTISLKSIKMKKTKNKLDPSSIDPFLFGEWKC